MKGFLPRITFKTTIFFSWRSRLRPGLRNFFWMSITTVTDVENPCQQTTIAASIVMTLTSARHAVALVSSRILSLTVESTVLSYFGIFSIIALLGLSSQ